VAATSSFIDPQNGDLATAEHVAQLVEDFQGLRNIPISLSGINDAATYALTLKNAGTGSRDLIAYAADGTTVLLQVDATGVTLGAPVNVPPGSISGTAIAAGSISNSQLGPDVARANQLVNGGMELWQRGGGAVTTGYTADRWLLEGTGLSVSQNGAPANVDTGSQFSAACTYNGTASNFSQFMEAYPGSLRGRVVSGSVRVKTSTPGIVRLTVSSDGTSPVAITGAAHTGDGTFQTLTAAAFTVPADATKVYFRVGFSGAAATVYVDNAMLVVGSQAANYVPMHPADDLARCLRYYEVIGGGSTGSISLGGYASATGLAMYAPVRFTMKPVVPTITKVGTWTGSNQPTFGGNDRESVQMALLATATGAFNTFNGTAGNCVTVESNP
jgi:hypothetical protein